MVLAQGFTDSYSGCLGEDGMIYLEALKFNSQLAAGAIELLPRKLLLQVCEYGEFEPEIIAELLLGGPTTLSMHFPRLKLGYAWQRSRLCISS